MGRLQRGDNTQTCQSLDRCGGDHFEVFNSVSAIWLWAIGIQSMLERVQSVVDGSITDGVNGNLKVERIGKVDNGKEFGWGPNGSGRRTVGIWLGQEGGTATLSVQSGQSAKNTLTYRQSRHQES